MKKCTIHSGGRYGSVEFTVIDDRVVRGSNQYGTTVYRINGNRIISGGKTAFTIHEGKIMEGDSKYGKVLFTITGDSIVEGNNKNGRKIYTIVYEESKTKAYSKNTLSATAGENEADHLKKEREALTEERKRVERERLALQKEREKLEYEQWFSSLSPEEKEAEKRRIQEEHQRIEKKLAEQRKLDQENAEKRKVKKKKTIITVVVAIALLLAVIVIFATVKSVIDKNKFNKSTTGQLLAYMSSLPEYENGKLTQCLVMESRGEVSYCVEYNKNGWTDNFNRICDFRITVVMPPKSEDQYSEVEGVMYFNLEGSDNENSFTGNGYPNFFAKAHYGSGYVVAQYQSVSYDLSADTIIHDGAYYNYTNWNSAYNDCIDEWDEAGWIACSSAFSWINGIFKDATGLNLYE